MAVLAQPLEHSDFAALTRALESVQQNAEHIGDCSKVLHSNAAWFVALAFLRWSAVKTRNVIVVSELQKSQYA